MNASQVLALLLAVSVALNLGCAAGIIAVCAESGIAQAILVGGGTVGGAMTLYLAGVGVYRRT